MNLFDNWEETKQSLVEGLSSHRASVMDAVLDNQRQYLIDTPPRFYLTDYAGNVLEEVRVLWRQQAERQWVETSTGGVTADGTVWFGESNGYWDGAQHDICRIARYDSISEEWVEETVKDMLVVDDRPRITKILPGIIRAAIPAMIAKDLIGEDRVLS